MAEYRYAGPGPHEDAESRELTRPGDVREFDTPPDGPWVPLAPPEAAPEKEPPAPPFPAAPQADEPITPKGK
jgi:hypothetical protein